MLKYLFLLQKDLLNYKQTCSSLTYLYCFLSKRIVRRTKGRKRNWSSFLFSVPSFIEHVKQWMFLPQVRFPVRQPFQTQYLLQSCLICILISLMIFSIRLLFLDHYTLLTCLQKSILVKASFSFLTFKHVVITLTVLFTHSILTARHIKDTSFLLRDHLVGFLCSFTHFEQGLFKSTNKWYNFKDVLGLCCLQILLVVHLLCRKYRIYLFKNITAWTRS